MMTIVSANSAFGFSDQKTLHGISWQKLTWMFAEYNKIHKPKEKTKREVQEERLMNLKI